jgi:hypothetical protein
MTEKKSLLDTMNELAERTDPETVRKFSESPQKAGLSVGLPPTREHAPEINLAEFTALKIIVLTVVNTVAVMPSKPGQRGAQEFINHLAAIGAEVADGIPGKTEEFRHAVRDQVVRILSGIKNLPGTPRSN